VNGVVAVTDEITPGPAGTPQAAGMTGTAFAVLIALAPALLPAVAHADPRAAGVLLIRASNRRAVWAARWRLPSRGIFLLWPMSAVRT
jgi:hypothetical protein